MTGHVEIFEGIPITVPNDIVSITEDYYISYNGLDIAIYGCSTTALVVTNPNKAEKFLILNGDHRLAYKEIEDNGGGYLGCLEYFKLNQDKKSKFSENWDEMLVMDNGKITYVKDPDCEN